MKREKHNKMGRNQRDEPTVLLVQTDWSEDLTVDCDTDDANLGDYLGTLIKHLQDTGVVGGSTTPK